jgi:tRNA-2-methylthio-N6-dimethylallyladenosine synthase
LVELAAADLAPVQEDTSKPSFDSSLASLLNAIYGCLKGYSYCVVSYARDLEQNRSLDAIRSELVSTAERGYRDVVLQDIDAYGRDMYPKRTFAELLRFLHDVLGIERIRFNTSIRIICRRA